MLVNDVFYRVGRSCLTFAARANLAGRARARAARNSNLGGVLRDDRGVAALEFGLLAGPLFLLLAGILEVSVMFFVNAVLEGATKETARQIRTGQIQEASGDPVTIFQDELCDALLDIIDCSQVVYDVQTFSSFGAVSMTIQIDEDGEVENTQFNPGGSGAVTVVRTIYRWEFFTPLIDRMLPSGPGGHMLVSTVAFQNEPYNVGGGGSSSGGGGSGGGGSGGGGGG